MDDNTQHIQRDEEHRHKHDDVIILWAARR